MRSKGKAGFKKTASTTSEDPIHNKEISKSLEVSVFSNAEDASIDIVFETVEINYWGKTVITQENLDTGEISRKLVLN